MWLDILSLSLLAYAFITGYQKGIIKTFSIWISAGIAFLLTLIASPYIFSFLEQSFHGYDQSLDLIALISTFIILLFFVYKGCKKALGSEDANSTFSNKLSGALLFSTLMVGSIVVLFTFMESAHLLKDTTKQSSHSYQYLKPIQDKTYLLFSEIKESAASVKGRSKTSQP